MILHLFYKEWLKTRWFVLISLLLGLSVVAYIFITVDNKVRMDGGFNYLMKVFYGVPQANYYSSLIKFIPLIIALCIGVAQYVPEVLERRIKLTLHLPIANTKAIYSMLIFGFALLLVINLFIFCVFFYLNNTYFPFEESWAILISITPWILGGIAAYFMIAMISMEPNLLYQVAYGLVGLFLVSQFYVGIEHADTRLIISKLIALSILPCAGLLYTSNRFFKGEK